MQKDIVVEDESPSPLQPLFKSMTSTNSSVTRNSAKITDGVQTVREKLEKEWATAKKWDKKLQEIRGVLQNMLDTRQEKGEDDKKTLLAKISHAKELIEVIKTLSQLPIIRIFDENVLLWNIPEVKACSGPLNLPPLPPTDSLRSQKLFDSLRGVSKRIEKNTKLINAEEEFVKKWIKESVSELMPQLDLSELEETGSHYDEIGDTGDNAVDDVRKLTKEKLYGLIDKRLMVERADRTGKVDYASIQAGASVIYSGPRTTSPSLVDKLPLFNRILAYWRLRFYGHGPEAAVTPTFPKNALGQCWSFEKNSSFKYKPTRNSYKLDQSNGRYATLSVRLPRPVQVSSVVIEHPPKEATNQVQSAIKNFRVVGYEDDMAEGKFRALGQFKYGINGKRTLQEFEVNVNDSDGSTIPMLQSITLAIDSNYDFPYACLYRFRVHGEEQLIIDDPEHE